MCGPGEASESDWEDDTRASEFTCGLTWKGFKERTTAHGIPHVDNATGFGKKVFWTLISLTALGFLIFNLNFIFEKYFGYPVDVRVKIKEAPQLTFPAVTICNMNPIKKSLLHLSPALSGVFGGSGVLKSRRKRAITGAPCPTATFNDGNIVRCYFMPQAYNLLNQASTLQECGATGDEPLIATLDTDDKINHIRSIFPEYANGTFWLNARASGRSGRNWYWRINTERVTVGSPSGSGDCIHMDPQQSYNFFPDDCRGNHYLICETSTTEAPTTESVPITTESATATTTAAGTTTTSTMPVTTTATTTATAATTTTSTVNPVSFEDTPQREDFVQAEKFTETLADLPQEEKQALGYTRDGLIMDCTYNGRTCHPNDTSEFFNPLHGNCFKFNYKGDRQSFKSGRRYGLAFILNIQQEEYLSTSGDVAGARLVVHDHRNMPFPEDDGIILPPGIHTSVGIKQFEIQQQGYPYSECVMDTELYNKQNTDLFAEIHGTKYAQTSCSKTCYQMAVTKRCNCGDPLYPMKGLALHNVQYPSCNSSTASCKNDVHDDFTANRLDCSTTCPTPCNFTFFSTRISLGEWPNESRKNAIIAELEAKTQVSLTDPTDPLKYKKNLLKVEVYFEQLNRESIEETPAYVWSQLVSDIGGLLGLYIGFSVVTIFEFLELGIDLLSVGIFTCTSWCFRKKPSVKPEAPPIPSHKKQPALTQPHIQKSKKQRGNKAQNGQALPPISSTPLPTPRDNNLTDNTHVRWSRRQSSVPTLILV